MAQTLVDRLLQAGLVEKAEADKAVSAMNQGQAVRRLVDGGVEEDALAGYFVAEGYGPLLDSHDLGRLEPDTALQLDAALAQQLLALPIRASAAGTIVAMAAPTDELAAATLRDALGSEVVPTVARVSELQHALNTLHPPQGRPSLPVPGASPSKRPAVVELTGGRRVARGRKESQALPLVRPKENTGTSPVADVRTVEPPPPSPSTPSGEWDIPDSLSLPPFEPGPYLDTIHNARDRDTIIETACEAAASAGRAACFVALRKNVFRGWYGCGHGVAADGVRTLWIPASHASILRDALHSQQVEHGPYGNSAADLLLRSSLGGLGERIMVAPVGVGERTVGLLCADDWRGTAAELGSFAEAVGQALERALASRKSR